MIDDDIRSIDNRLRTPAEHFRDATKMKSENRVLGVCMNTICFLKMTLKVPRVYDNWQSTGYRRYQRQTIIGTVVASENETTVTLENKTHKVGGINVTYDCSVNQSEFHLIGNNLTGVFNRSSVTLGIEALPSYVPTYNPTDDETLVIVLSGSGTINRIRGYVAGTLGCGCAWYGHTSPTRDMFTCSVVDKAAVWGTFKLKRRSI